MLEFHVFVINQIKKSMGVKTWPVFFYFVGARTDFKIKNSDFSQGINFCHRGIKPLIEKLMRPAYLICESNKSIPILL